MEQIIDTNGIPPRSKVRNVVMDRTPRPIDRDTALAMVLELGHGQIVFLSIETQSWGRTFDNALGYTHCPENAQDHYWRLICVDKQWHFQYVDYSPKAQSGSDIPA